MNRPHQYHPTADNNGVLRLAITVPVDQALVSYANSSPSTAETTRNSRPSFDLARRARGAWRDQYRDILPDDLLDRVTVEPLAGEILIYEPQTVPDCCKAAATRWPSLQPTQP